MKAFASFGAAVVGAAFLLYRKKQESLRGVDGGADAAEAEVDRTKRHIIIHIKNEVSGRECFSPFEIVIGSSQDGTIYYNDICAAIAMHIKRPTAEIDLKIYNKESAIASTEDIKNMVETSSTLTIVLQERAAQVEGAGEGFVGGFDDGAAMGGGAGASHVDRLRQRAASGYSSGQDLM